MNFKESQRLLYDAQKHDIDASCLSVRAKDRDAKAVKALKAAVKAAKNPSQSKKSAPKPTPKASEEE